MNEFIVWDENDNLVGYEYLSEKGRWTFILENEGIERVGNICPSFDKKLFKLPCIHKTDINGKKIYADCSIVEFKIFIDGRNEPLERRGFFTYNDLLLRYEVKLFDFLKGNRGGGIYDFDACNMGDFKIIDTIQENKLGLMEKSNEN